MSLEPSSQEPSFAPGATPTTPGRNAFLSPPRTRRERRNPSVTPRRFARFFGPMLPGTSSAAGRGRSALNEVGGFVANRQTPRVKRKLFDSDSLSLPPVLSDPEPLTKRSRVQASSSQHPFSDENIPTFSHRLAGGEYTPQEDNLPSSPWARREALMKSLNHRHLHPLDADSDNNDVMDMEEPAPPPQPIKRFRPSNFHDRLVAREFGYSTRAPFSAYQHPVPDTHPDLASFCSKSNDTVQCTSFKNGSNLIPFSLATTSHQGTVVTAVGDEEGYVRFITRKDDGELAPKYFWQAHANAIMDLDWSPSGTHIATAAGDRSARVLDVNSQTLLFNLTGGHDSCLRQVKFQPGNVGGHILATSDRTSRIQIWDTRYKKSVSKIPEEVFVQPDGTVLSESTSSCFGEPINTVWSGHYRKHDSNLASVTSLQDDKPKPLAYTAQPMDHIRRPYGITSMALNTDASRLYAVCKNGTVYAYSTSHLILGHGPELATLETPAPETAATSRASPPSTASATTVSRCWPSVAPTTAPSSSPPMNAPSAPAGPSTPPTPPPQASPPPFAGSRLPYASAFLPVIRPLLPAARTPVVRNGVALVEGTSREVSSVKWTADGQLVSISDDYSVRFWSADADKARFLRNCGDFGGERFNAGWADVVDTPYDE
ncbi:unnamed protein product [Parascedosporium putredinis]|uniref:WD40 repeat-like protein n=1 Tax=Parascedosporium putredinis TaxID=1442378 RepID=A0A9P1GUD2_9PEZI|nr:unnamed protein product [Parascedosporium putredinis]CAI7987501.1 unnamed protein product [Parascedosporium putredinis]